MLPDMEDEVVEEEGTDKTIVPRTVRTNWAAIFLAFAKGAKLEKLSEVYGVPLVTLERTAARGGWVDLAASLPINPEKLPDASRDLKKIEENRRHNLKMFETLREEMVETIGKLQRGELEIEQLFSTKTEIRKATRGVSPQ